MKVGFVLLILSLFLGISQCLDSSQWSNSNLIMGMIPFNLNHNNDTARENIYDNMFKGFNFEGLDLRLPPTNGEQYSGLITVDEENNGEMFYWIFKCKNESAPLLIWLEGGPGIPGSFQVFYGMGPYRISHDLSVTLNNETWNNDYHLLFFDNPIGVGYSSVENNAFVTNEEQVASQLAIAIDTILNMYTEFSNTKLYLFGESYGGKYVPALSYYILNNPNLYSWTFDGIGIGDGLVDTPTQVTTFADFIYYHGIASLKEKQFIEDLQNQFTEAYNNEEYNLASNIFWNINYFIQYKNIVNFYNVDCDVSCGLETYMWGGYSKLLNEPSIKQQLNVPLNYTFNSQQPKVSGALNPDVCKSVAPLFIDLLSNYKTLIYQGTLDMICNAAGNDLWLSQVNWSGNEEFQQQTKQNWMDGVNVAGWIRKQDNLTQIVFPNAGHMVTMDQPSRSRTMVYNWMYDIPFPTSTIPSF
mmetsp:Transcript_35140/g.60170  ORF Transcript_35140/g.60170 Transcript_35140/m.60170 type:complete len:470 (-) Transcript_35140:20-1429(-)